MLSYNLLLLLFCVIRKSETYPVDMCQYVYCILCYLFIFEGVCLLHVTPDTDLYRTDAAAY